MQRYPSARLHASERPDAAPNAMPVANYLLADCGGWEAVRGAVDEIWYLEVSRDVMASRLIGRHHSFGKSLAQAQTWTHEMDLHNAELSRSTRARAGLVVKVSDTSSGPVSSCRTTPTDTTATVRRVRGRARRNRSSRGCWRDHHHRRRRRSVHSRRDPRNLGPQRRQLRRTAAAHRDLHDPATSRRVAFVPYAFRRS